MRIAIILGAVLLSVGAAAFAGDTHDCEVQLYQAMHYPVFGHLLDDPSTRFLDRRLDDATAVFAERNWQECYAAAVQFAARYDYDQSGAPAFVYWHYHAWGAAWGFVTLYSSADSPNRGDRRVFPNGQSWARNETPRGPEELTRALALLNGPSRPDSSPAVDGEPSTSSSSPQQGVEADRRTRATVRKAG